MTPRTATTALGPVELDERGRGVPVLVLHGSPGGADQAELMARFLPTDVVRAITVSRPGYLGTPLTGHEGWDAQADLLAAVLDHLDVDRCTVLAWSGGGPPAYRLAVRHPERVAAVVGVATVTTAIELPAPSLPDRVVFGTRVGVSALRWLAAHQPRQVVQNTLAHEGDLTPEQLTALVDHVLADPDQRAFTLELGPTAATGGRRRAGYRLEGQLFARAAPLQLEQVSCPVLLVHGDADTDVPVQHSLFAAEHLPDVELRRVPRGTHLVLWAHEDARALQEHVLAFVRRTAAGRR